MRIPRIDKKMGPPANLSKLRKIIDQIDKDLLRLLNKRANVALNIRNLKNEKEFSVYDPVREKEIERALKELNKGPLKDSSVIAIFREIISACRGLQQPLKIAYLGPKGSFSHQAAHKEFGNTAVYSPVGGFNEVFEEIENLRADYGVVPVENSIEGSIGAVLDILTTSEARVVSECYESIKHFLISKSTSIKDIKTVASHPQALGQCRKWLNANLSGVEYIETPSTAEAVRMATRRKNFAAIGSEYASSIYKLNVLKKNIEDTLDNSTRFFVIGHDIPGPSVRDKTSIVFSLKDKPGALDRYFFKPFGEARINLTKIESRPSKQSPWEYMFFVDFEGHLEDERIKKLLGRVRRNATFLKVLGSYPAGN